ERHAADGVLGLDGERDAEALPEGEPEARLVVEEVLETEDDTRERAGVDRDRRLDVAGRPLGRARATVDLREHVDREAEGDVLAQLRRGAEEQVEALRAVLEVREVRGLRLAGAQAEQ